MGVLDWVGAMEGVEGGRRWKIGGRIHRTYDKD